MELKPFWRYYGGKWLGAPKYPKPEFDTIIEPFAGAAGYSLRYYDKNIILIEKYPIIANIWKYLINVSSEEILSIPLVENIADLPGWVPDEAKNLIGFLLNSATVSPSSTLSAGLKRLIKNGHDFYGWSEKARNRVAKQVNFIRHWKIIEGDYTEAPVIEATYFIDPPYQKMGKYYKHKINDYKSLALWCKSLPGQVIVCEGKDADWLPFKPFIDIAGMGSKYSKEFIWLNNSEINSSIEN